MTHRTFECEQFIYDKADFERDIMCWVKIPPAKDLKRLIDEDFRLKPKCFRTAVYKRILNYKTETGRWWIENWKLLTTCQREQEQEELTAIWKMGRDLCRNFYLQQWDDSSESDDDDDEDDTKKAVNFHFYSTLEKFEEQLEKEEINEQQFITRCNNMKDHKKQLETLFNACACSTMCRHNQAMIGESTELTDVLRIICMPCGFL